MTVESVIPCICSSKQVREGEANSCYDGMPILKVSNLLIKHRQQWSAECPKCGRGGCGVEEYSAFKALQKWNEIQTMLHESVGVYEYSKK